MVVAVAMRLRHGSTMSDSDLANALAAGFGALVLGIAHEDNGSAQAPTGTVVNVVNDGKASK